MPSSSPFPDVTIPDVDLWGLMFDRKDRDFPDDKVLYRAVDSSRAYTFTDVKAHATAFGEGLCNLWDWQRGDVLALFAPNDIDIPPIIYGAFFAGGVVTPANPGYSADELAYQLENAEAKGLVTTKAFLNTALQAAQKIGLREDRVILLGAEKDPSHRVKHWTNIRKTSGALRYRRRKASPSSLSFLAYSSGTTGLPKGVMLTHRNIIADVLQIHGSVGHHYSPQTDKFLGVLPFFHIYGLTGLVHQILHRGIECVVLPSFTLPVFLSAIQTHKITFIYVAPPVIVHLARSPLVASYDLSSLRMITSGAAPLTRELVSAVHSRLGLKINQAYGLSETSPMTHTQPWNEWLTSVGSVGKMFPNMQAKYMLPSGHEAAPSQVGELWLKGPNVFAGYWKNPSATKDALTKDGYFKTGDVGYQDQDANFYITDRVKELIKYKGFQVAPAELEGKLLDCEGVADVAVIGVQDGEMHTEVPRAYVVAATKEQKTETKGQAKPGESEARAIVDWIAGRVANHKRLRGGVVFVDEVPKSASGKILRRVLKERAGGDVGLGVGARAKL
ncbi:hypothetical protein E8E13_005541 [Curvularia kusanoi]|uniref:Acetyl-CoA synthetase-like protein n=1 Tax=Curvularia kusanoi TaxID=90978 RepID=A0A9P4TLM0_CURKU|nr:hypothetical protein E8E13_005541 [Curvularia kusanoi]